MNQWNGFFIRKYRIIRFILSDHFSFLVVLNKRNNKSMRNCISKFNDKPFNLHTPPLTSGHHKKVASGIWKNPVKYFAMGAHQKYGYETGWPLDTWNTWNTWIYLKSILVLEKVLESMADTWNIWKSLIYFKFYFGLL